MTHNLKRTLILTACSALFSMLPLAATPTPPACQDNATLATYQALNGGCIIGDKLFSNFTYQDSATSGLAGINAADITVDTVGPGQGITNPDIGLRFNAAWVVTSNQFLDSVIGFTVTVLNGYNLQIEDAGVGTVDALGGTGISSVAEHGCAAPCDPTTGNPWDTYVFNTAGTQASQHAFFAPTGSVSVLKDISVVGGSNGFAHLSVVQDTFSQVPEPRALALLLGLGLLGGGVFRKKFLKASA